MHQINTQKAEEVFRAADRSQALVTVAFLALSLTLLVAALLAGF